MAKSIDWKKLVVKALHHVVVEGEKEIAKAVRKVLEKENIHPVAGFRRAVRPHEGHGQDDGRGAGA